jgi:hypothetical protein
VLVTDAESTVGDEAFVPPTMDNVVLVIGRFALPEDPLVVEVVPAEPTVVAFAVCVTLLIV